MSGQEERGGTSTEASLENKQEDIIENKQKESLEGDASQPLSSGLQKQDQIQENQTEQTNETTQKGDQAQTESMNKDSSQEIVQEQDQLQVKVAPQMNEQESSDNSPQDNAQNRQKHDTQNFQQDQNSNELQDEAQDETQVEQYDQHQSDYQGGDSQNLGIQIIDEQGNPQQMNLSSEHMQQLMQQLYGGGGANFEAMQEALGMQEQMQTDAEVGEDEEQASDEETDEENTENIGNTQNGSQLQHEQEQQQQKRPIAGLGLGRGLAARKKGASQVQDKEPQQTKGDDNTSRENNVSTSNGKTMTGNSTQNGNTNSTAHNTLQTQGPTSSNGRGDQNNSNGNGIGGLVVGSANGQRRSGLGNVTQASVNGTAPQQQEVSEEVQKIRNGIQDFRIQICRAAMRIAGPNYQSSISQTLARLDTAERLKTGIQSLSKGVSDKAIEAANKLEEEDPQSLQTEVTILVIGPQGGGKTTTIKNILGHPRSEFPDPFQGHTKKVEKISANVNGVKFNFIDTPGLKNTAGSVNYNARLLSTALKQFKRHKANLLLYVDRIDQVKKSFQDLPIVRSIGHTFGESVWFSTMMVYTNAQSLCPDEDRNQFDALVAQKHQNMAQTIKAVVRDPRLQSPYSVVENHHNCPTNSQGQQILPNNVVFKQTLLMQLVQYNILKQAEEFIQKNTKKNNKSKQPQMNNLFNILNFGRQKLPPVSYLATNMVQQKRPNKFPEEEREFVTENQLTKMTSEDKVRESRKRDVYIRAKEEEAKSQMMEAVSIPAPEAPIPPCFEPQELQNYKYKYLENGSSFTVRPQVDNNSPDHQDGIEGVYAEKRGVLRKPGQFLGGFPMLTYVQVQRDKQASSFVANAEASIHHTQNWVSTQQIEGQTIQGGDKIYILRLDTRIKSNPSNKTGVGLLFSRLQDDSPLAVGGRLEDTFRINKGLKAFGSVSKVQCQTQQLLEEAISAQLELRAKNSQNEAQQVTSGLSYTKYRGDTAFGLNVSAQTSISKETVLITKTQINLSKKTGSVNIRLQSHDKPNLGYGILVPFVGLILGRFRSNDLQF